MNDPNQAISSRDRLLDHIKHVRKYGQQFVNWTELGREAGRQARERKVTLEWDKAVHRGKGPYVIVESCSPPKPDCELIDKEGKKTGVEVTELIDQEMIERNVNKVVHGRVYTCDQFSDAVAKRLEEKERKLEQRADFIRSQGYEKMILIIHVGEPELEPDFCRACLENQTFQKLQFIDEAFLLFKKPRAKHADDYEADFCQVIAIC